MPFLMLLPMPLLMLRNNAQSHMKKKMLDIKSISRNMKTLISACLLLLAVPINGQAQLASLIDTVNLTAEFTGTLNGHHYSPYWMANNRYGLSCVEDNWAMMRVGAFHDIGGPGANNYDPFNLNPGNTPTTIKNWQTGWGADFAYITGSDARMVVQQLYADIQYKKVRLSIGAKQRPSEGLNPLLSSGGMADGNNHRPIPQIRIELPDFWTIPGTKGWLALKAHIAYGAFTDNRWQRDFAAAGTVYSKNSLYHTKAGYLRIGNAEKFPLTITGGLEMNTQFAGTAYNLGVRDDDNTGRFSGGTLKMKHNLRAFWDAFALSGSDATDAQYSNTEGNTVGAWHLSLDYHGDGWGARAYAQHLFEDHSQLFWQYGWKDMMWGLEARLPKNPIVSTVVYEYLNSRDQSGPIYHDHTANVPDQVSAIDNYYNHVIYGAWQMAGYGLGNGLFLSPVYNNDGRITFRHNRIKAHHFGLMGQPTREIGYRALFSWERSWGTYSDPLLNPMEGWTLLLETTWKPRFLRGWGAALSFGHNGGRLFNNSNGLQLTISWNGIAHL